MLPTLPVTSVSALTPVTVALAISLITISLKSLIFSKFSAVIVPPETTESVKVALPREIKPVFKAVPESVTPLRKLAKSFKLNLVPSAN